MATLLIAVIYAAFIGLGLPDSLFGASWPSIYTEFGLPFSLGGLVSAICFVGTTVSSLLSTWLIKRLGTNRLTAACTLLTALAMFGYSVSGNFFLPFRSGSARARSTLRLTTTWRFTTAPRR